MKKLIWLLGFAMLAGCAGDDDSSNGGGGQPGEVRVAHFTTAISYVDVYVDGTPALSDVGYGDVSNYVTVAAGNRNVQIATAGSNPPNYLFSETFPVAAGTASTVAATGSFFELSVIAYTDDRHIDTTQAKLRFIHLSPDVDDVDVDAVGLPQLFTAVHYTQGTTYHAIAAGTRDVLIRQAGTNTIVYSLSDMEVSAGHNYTLFLAGSGTAREVVKVVDAGE